MNSQRMMAAYIEAGKEAPDFDDKCRTGLEAVMRTSGEGDGGILVDQLKQFISFVCKSNQDITDTIMTYQDEILKLMAGEEECLKFVNQYFNTTSEMLAFCTALDRFVVSSRDSHSYIAHVIQKLQTDYGKETTDDVDDNGFKKIVEILGNLKGSGMVSCSDSAESLYLSIQGLKKKMEDMNDALQRYQNKLNEKLEANLFFKEITNKVLMWTIVCAGVLSLLALSMLIASPHLAVLAGGHLIGSAATMVASNPHAVLGTAVVLKCSLPVLGTAKHMASCLFDQCEDKIRKQQGVVDSMKDGALIAIKELGDIESLIEKLLTQIDSIVKKGKLGMNHSDDITHISVSYAIQAIKDNLGIFLERIEELDKEQKRCTSEIRRARDDVLTKLTSKVKKGKQA